MIADINLTEYQQQPDILKVFITPEDNPPFELGVASIQESLEPNKLAYYQGVWVMNKETQALSYPLVLQYFVVYPQETQGVLIDKKGQMPFHQNLTPVQTASLEVIPVLNPDTSAIVRLPEAKTIHTPAGDFKTIMIKTYNPATEEGLIQYLAKDLGTVRLESFNKNKHSVVAELKSYRKLTQEETQSIIKSLPKELQLS